MRNSLVIDPELFARWSCPPSRRRPRPGRARQEPADPRGRRRHRPRRGSTPTRGLRWPRPRRSPAAITAVAPGQDELVDNISNTLQVARDDARVAKRMFVLPRPPRAPSWPRSWPPTPAASWPARNAASRRSCASGAPTAGGCSHARPAYPRPHRGRLGARPRSRPGLRRRRSPCGRARAGLDWPACLLGPARRRRRIPRQRRGPVRLGSSGHQAGHRRGARPALVPSPAWRRLRLDLAALLVVGHRRGGRVARRRLRGSGRLGLRRTVRVAARELLVVPIGVWVAGILVLARMVERGLARLPVPDPPRFGRLPWAILTRSLRRRPWSATGGVIVVALIVALGTSVASFTVSYNRAKAADARFAVGSDIRVTPGPASTVEHPPGVRQRPRRPRRPAGHAGRVRPSQRRASRARSTRTPPTWPRSTRPPSRRSPPSTTPASRTPRRRRRWRPWGMTLMASSSAPMSRRCSGSTPATQ